MTARSVVLFLPSVSLLEEVTLADQRREFPRLAWCLSAATRTPHAGPLEPLLAACVGLDPTTATAELTALHDFPARNTPVELLRCDPIHLHADPNKVLVYGGARLDLSAADADALIMAIQREFPELACRRGISPNRWYVDRPPEVTGIAPSVHWLNGRSLTPFMPLAASERAWRHRLNDLQMVLHEQPVNQARVERGQLPVNGVWWFGAGTTPHNSRARCTQLIGNDVLVAGIARATGVAWQPRGTAQLTLQAPGETLVMAGNGFGEAADDPLISIADIEALWLPPLISAVRRRGLNRLILITASHRVELGWRKSLRTWRSPQSFAID